MFRVKLALAGATLLTIISTCYGQESLANGDRNSSRSCNIAPLGIGRDDTDQILSVVEKCGTNGNIVLEAGQYNVTRKMTWDLRNSRVDLFGVLNFAPDIEYWLDPNNTYRVVFIQSQASWFVITGNNFIIDAHGKGGINGNGQPWWEYFTSRTRRDGDGRPISLTLFNASNAEIRNFHIDSPPFWCNTVASSKNVVYDRMTCNATNTNPEFFGQNIVPNTDGICTYRSERVTLLNWDITCGDDCLAIKGNTTNLFAKNYICRGGNGPAFGSLGQYTDMPDIVENIFLEDFTSGSKLMRINSSIQPNMRQGLYFKSWTGSVSGEPPTGGGGGGGYVKNVVAKDFALDSVDMAVHLYQTNGGHSGDVPSSLRFSDLHFVNWKGTTTTNRLVDIECSANAPCPNITFRNFDVSPPSGQAPRLVCVNTVDINGLPAPCNTTGQA